MKKKSGSDILNLSIIPKPAGIVAKNGEFEIDSETVICCSEDMLEVAEVFVEQISKSTGFDLDITTGVDTNVISLVSAPLAQEAYRLKVSPDFVEIKFSGKSGAVYGLQTLRQLMPVEVYSETEVSGIKWNIRCLEIEDTPRFRWRGMHLDVGRYFYDKEFVKKYIDWLALYKYNIFHFHLTDDHGWRIEIKKYPLLTKVGAFRKQTLIGHDDDRPRKYDRKPYGGFYTQDDIKDIVEYARRRCVTIVPEIEMPGHAQAAIAAYPYLGNNSDKQVEVACEWGIKDVVFNVEDSTIEFLKGVLLEVMELFPSQYIHIGGDECLKEEWRNSHVAQARIKQLGLKDEDELQSWFINQIDMFLKQHNRKLIGWDEILDGGIASGATVMSWRGDNGAIQAAEAGHDVVMTDNRYTYFDYYQGDTQSEPLAIHGLISLEKTYEFNPVPAELSQEQAQHILGAQGQVWTEYISNQSHLEYMVFPRCCALSEVLWSDSKDDYECFESRLVYHLRRLDMLGINYRKLDVER